MKGFQKGNTHSKGRPPGARNLTTAGAKAAVLKAMAGELENLSNYLKRIKSPKDRIDAIVKLLPYILPKQNHVELEDIATTSWIENLDITLLPEKDLKRILSAFNNQTHGNNNEGASRED